MKPKCSDVPHLSAALPCVKSKQQMGMNMSSGSLILGNVLLEHSIHSLTLTKASTAASVKQKTRLCETLQERRL